MATLFSHECIVAFSIFIKKSYMKEQDIFLASSRSMDFPEMENGGEIEKSEVEQKIEALRIQLFRSIPPGNDE